MFRVALRVRTALIAMNILVLGVSDVAAPPDENQPICTIPFSHQAPQATNDGCGGAIVAWHDLRDSSDVFDIHAQRIGNSGGSMWTAEGVRVVGESGAQLNPKVASDICGGAFVVWEDQRLGSDWDIYGQRLNADGTSLWGPSGIAISAVSGDQLSLEISEDGFGGILVVWVDHRAGPSEADVYAQRLDATGTAIWETNGLRVCAAQGAQEQPQIIAQGDGGGLLVWKDKRVSSGDIYTQRITALGAVAWDTSGVLVCGATGSQDSPRLVSTGLGGAIITWGDRRSGNGDIYAQRVDSTGAALWTPNGVGIIVDSDNQHHPRIERDEASGAIICWPDGRFDSSIFANRITCDGLVVWNPLGVPICQASGTSVWPKVAIDGSGGAVIVWEDTRNTPLKPDLYSQRVDSDGNVLWATNGVPVTTASEDQRYADIVPRADGGMIVVWEDWRDGGFLANRYRIYSQLVAGDGSLPVSTSVGVGGITPPPFVVRQNWPNPFSDLTTVPIKLHSSGTVTAIVFDVRGRAVVQRRFPGLAAGRHDLVLEARDLRGNKLPSGIYYYRVTAMGYSISRKMTVLR